MLQGFYQRRYFHVLLVFIFMMPIVLAGTRRAILSNTNDVKAWLPEEYPETVDLHWFQEHFGGDEFVLVSWEGCTLDDPRLELLVRKLLAPSEDRPRYFNGVLTGPQVIDRLTSPPTDLSREVALERMEGSLVGPDGHQTCAVLTVAPEGKAHRRDMIELVYQTAEVQCAIPRDELRMGGPPVDNVAVDTEGERTLMRLAGLSGLMGLVLCWWCLRRAHLVAIVMFVGIFSAGFALAAVYFTGTTMDAILFSMPTLVYVLALSGAIHIVNYYRDTLHEDGFERAPERAIAHAWMPCGLAAFTTAIGLGSLVVSELIPVQKFGIYSAAGVLLTLSVLFLFLPSLLQAFPARYELDEAAAPAVGGDGQPATAPATAAATRRGGFDSWPLWPRLGQIVIERSVPVTIVALLVMGAIGWGLSRIETSVNLLKLFSEDARIIQDYAWLEEHMGALIPMEVVVRFDDEKCALNFYERLRLVEQVQDAIEDLPAVGSTLSPASFAPELAPPPRPRGIGGALATLAGGDRTWRSVVNKQLLRHRDEFLDGDFLADSDVEELWRVSVRVAARENMSYVTFVDSLKAQVEPLLAGYRQHGYQGIEAKYTGLMPVVYKAQEQLFIGLFESFLLAFGLIAVVMMCLLRSVVSGLVAMIPNIFPAVMIFGTMGWSNILVDIGSMMTASVAMGVAVDDTIHYLTWFRRGLDMGLDRKSAVRYSYQRCARAMFQTTLIGGLGLSVFAFSSFQPTQRFGVLMLSLMSAALVGDLVVLPALLSGPLGRFFERRRGAPRSPAREEAAVAAEAAFAAEAVAAGQRSGAAAPETSGSAAEKDAGQSAASGPHAPTGHNNATTGPIFARQSGSRSDAGGR